MSRILQYLCDVGAALDAVNRAKISAPTAKEQRPGIGSHERGEHQGCGEHEFHLNSPICSA